MKINKQTVDLSDERKIIINSIADTNFLKSIFPILQVKLFKSSYSKIVVEWIRNYYIKYEEAPNNNIESIYINNKSNMENEDFELIGQLLDSVSREYEKNHNTEYSLDQAETYLKKQKLELTQDKLETLINSGDLTQAESVIANYTKLERPTSGGMDLSTTDLKDVIEYQAETLFTFPGDLGNLCGSFGRGDFFAIFAPPKRGKCVSEDMVIMLSDGRLKTIKDIVTNKIKTPILTLNEKTKKIQKTKITEFWDNGIKSCSKVITRTGREVETTNNHQYLTPDGWKYLKDIRVGEYIAVPKRLDFFGKIELPINELKFIGFMLADGCCHARQPSFTKTDGELVAQFLSICQALNIGFTKHDISYHLTQSIPLLKKYGMRNDMSKDKVIPEIIFSCTKEQIRLFLKTFFSCDGSIFSGKRNENIIEITLASEKLINQIRHLLIRFGIVCKKTYKQAKCNGKIFDAWKLCIKDQENVNLFLTEINFFSYKYREPNTDFMCKSQLDALPYQETAKWYSELNNNSTGKSAFKILGTNTSKKVCGRINKKLPTTRECLLKAKEYQETQKYLNSDILWDRVESIGYGGDKHTYDLSIPEHHNFICNDCIVHNTWLLLDQALTAYRQGLNVIFFSFEMSEKGVMRRLLQMVKSAPKRRLKKELVIPVFTSDGSIDYEPIFPKPLSYKDATKTQKALLRNNKGRLKLKSYPAFSGTLDDIMAHLNILEHFDNFIPDVIIVDYADIIAPDAGAPRDYRQLLDYIWKKLRGLAQIKNCFVGSASQTGRQSMDRDVKLGDVSEDMRKLAHITGGISLNQTDDEKKAGIMRFKPMLFREEEFSGYDEVIGLQSLAIGQPILDCRRSDNVELPPELKIKDKKKGAR